MEKFLSAISFNNVPTLSLFSELIINIRSHHESWMASNNLSEINIPVRFFQKRSARHQGATSASAQPPLPPLFEYPGSWASAAIVMPGFALCLPTAKKFISPFHFSCFSLPPSLGFIPPWLFAGSSVCLSPRHPWDCLGVDWLRVADHRLWTQVPFTLGQVTEFCAPYCSHWRWEES